MKQIKVVWSNGDCIVANISKARRSYTKYGEFRQIEPNIIEHASFSGHYRFYVSTGKVELDTGPETREASCTFTIGDNLQI